VSLSTDSLIAMVPDRFGCRTSEFDGGNPRGHPETHILGDTFYSQAPLRFGGFIAKISVAPKSPELRALTQAPLNVMVSRMVSGKRFWSFSGDMRCMGNSPPPTTALRDIAGCGHRDFPPNFSRDTYDE
jgi:hypothetical protein